MIQKMFGAIAPNYDWANCVLSFNLHKRWNRKLVEHATCDNPTSLLDLCAGTGEIAHLWLKKNENKSAILLDFCPEMLEVARKRPYKKGHKLSFLEANAEAIPLPTSCVEAITLAYGIRNVQTPSRCFQEAYRVLKPRGTLAILELTEPSNPLIRQGHNFYLKHFLPTLGGWLTRKPDAYRYLSTSIQAFIKPSVLAEELAKKGFTSIQITPLTFGIAHLITAKKPH